MKNMFKFNPGRYAFAGLFVTALFLTACEETVDLDLDQTEARLVIDGQVTDRADRNYVRISRTVGFYNSGAAPRVTDATVNVEDDAGNTFPFVHYQGESTDSVGMYFPETPFTAVVGRTYKLSVQTNGTTYTAQDKLLRIVPMDKLEYRINEDEQEDPEDAGRFYEILLFVREPQDTEDYYLFKFYRNNVVEYAIDTDIYLAEDKLLSENIDGIPSPIFYGLNDLARIEAYSLSSAAYLYFSDLQKLLNNDGGLFGTPPANPRTNLSNGAMGFFLVTSIESGEITVGE